MGKSKADEMSFWTKEEFNAFADCVIDKRESWPAFQILFWIGMQIGELLALEINDANLQTGVISVTKSYQHLRGKDIITPSKTPKSIRDITIPEFLTEDIRDYLEDRYEPGPDEPLIPVTKTFLEKALQRGIFRNTVLTEIGQAHGKSAAQTALCWNVQKGNVVIPRSTKVDHMKENLDIFDFGLAPEEMKAIDTLDRGHSAIMDFENPATGCLLMKLKIHDDRTS